MPRLSKTPLKATNHGNRRQAMTSKSSRYEGCSLSLYVSMLCFFLMIQGLFILHIRSYYQDLFSQLRDKRLSMIQGFDVHDVNVSKIQSISRSKDDEMNTNEYREYHTICSVPPGKHTADINPEGFQVLNIMQELQRKEREKQKDDMENTVLLLCVLPFLSHGEQEAILSTYARECDKILILAVAEPQSTQIVGTNVMTIYTRTDNRQRIFDAISSLKPFDWIHWAKPAEYAVIPLLKAAALAPLARNSELKGYPFDEEKPEVPDILENIKDEPLVLSTWLLKDFDRIFHVQGKKIPSRLKQFQNDLGCDVAQTFTRASLQNLYLAQQTNSTFRRPSNTTLFEPKPMENGTTCVTPDFVFREYMSDCKADENPYCEWTYLYYGIELWSPLKRYTQISLATGDSTKDSYYRVHAILNGLCKQQWAKDSYQVFDASGEPGYVHDPTFLKKKAPKFQPFFDHDFSGGNCEEGPGDGIEGEHGFKGIQKIRTDLPEHVARMNKTVLCMVYTYSGNREYLNAIAETWGPKCDGFVASSDETDPSVGAVHIAHEGGESYGNMWNKLRAMYKYAHDNHLHDFDFFYFSGDDVYLLVENLKYMISNGGAKGPWNESQPMFVGSPRAFRDSLMCLGGPGYVLNRKSLQLLVDSLETSTSCLPHYRGPQEDRFISSCLLQKGLTCTDSNDDKGEARFHYGDIERHSNWINGISHKKGWKFGEPLSKQHEYLPRHGIQWKEGMGQISDRSVSFHMRRLGKRMRRYHGLLYGLCPNLNLTNRSENQQGLLAR